jgi:molecular chaperone DnaJ
MVSRSGPVTSRGRDVSLTIDVGFIEALKGAERTFEVELPVACDTCSGKGFSRGETVSCPQCNGTGAQTRSSWFSAGQSTCGHCGGTGRVAKTPCPSCSGQGRKSSRRTIRVRIPPGADTGNEIRLKGRGEAGVRGGPAGDLILRLQVQPHADIGRDGLDLTFSVPVTVPEAYTGAKIRVHTPWDAVLVSLPTGASSGQKLRVRGHGIRKSKGKKGDLIIVLQIMAPDVRDDDTESHVRALEGSYSTDPRARNPFE